MFSVKGTFYGRGDEKIINRTDLSLEEMRRVLAKDLYMGYIDGADKSETVPNAYDFYFEEADATVIALDDDSLRQLEAFANAADDEGCLFIEGDTPEDDKWADGEPMTDEDRNAAIIG